MESRMDRYNEEGSKTSYSRSDKNKTLYENINNNTIYTNVTDVSNSNAYDITNIDTTINTRESYHKIKGYRDVEVVPKVKKELDDFNYLYQNRENRVYDINMVLDEARKNREKDVNEDRRKLKNSNYNIITSLSKEDLERYRKERQNRVITPEQEELRSLIDTITSKTLAGEIDKATSVDLLSDLMATNIMDKVPAVVDSDDIDDPDGDSHEEEVDAKLDLSKQVLDKGQLEEIKKLADDTSESILSDDGMDKDFYTKSMDLTGEDFEVDPEFQEEKMSPVLKAILVILLLSAIVVAAYFIWKYVF